MSLTFLSLNIEADRHLDLVRAYLEKNEPDVVCLQEIFRIHAEQFAKKLGYHMVFAPHVIFSQAGGEFPPLGEWGIAIMTKLRVQKTDTTYYGAEGDMIPDRLNAATPHPRALLTAEIEHDGKMFLFATTHFTWAMPRAADQMQHADMLALQAVLDKLPDFVLAGDFNAPRNTELFRRFSELYRSHVPLDVETTIDQLLHRAAPLELVVDHLFSKGDYIVTDVNVVCGLSDHCAITANIDKLS